MTRYLFIIIASLVYSSFFIHSLNGEEEIDLNNKRISSIQSCGSIATFLEARKFKIGAELGVQRGYMSEHNLRNWPSCQRYYLIDLWEKQENYLDVANTLDHDINLAETRERMKPFGHVPVIMKNTTNDASFLIPDESLDFIYVDARHDYCGVLEDIQNWWPKLKVGGVMAGHDYLFASQVTGQDWSICGNGTKNAGAVKGAVQDFAREKGLRIHSTSTTDEWPCWVYNPKRPQNKTFNFEERQKADISAAAVDSVRAIEAIIRATVQGANAAIEKIQMLSTTTSLFDDTIASSTTTSASTSSSESVKPVEFMESDSASKSKGTVNQVINSLTNRFVDIVG